MYGRNSSNIFNRNVSSNSSSSNGGGNIFARNNNSTNNSFYGNNNSNNSYSSSNNAPKLGTNRVTNYNMSSCPRMMEEINGRWKPNELIPMSISVRPETMHLAVVELRIQDYFLIRTNKIDRDHERLVKDAVDKGHFNPDLVNSHIVSNLKEPATLLQGEVSIDILKQLNKNRVLHGTNNSNSNNYSSSNNNSGNIFSSNNNNNPYSRNNSSSNNIFGNNSSNSSSSNIFGGNNNNSNSRNIFSNSNNNSSNNNISSSNNNIFNRNNNSSNNIFGGNNNNNNNSSSSNNIFGNSNNNNSRNIFNNGGSGNNNNNSSSSNIFGNNGNNSNRNIFENNSSNNNSSNNNSNSNNNNSNSRNIFNNNNNSSNNNIFNNGNNNNNRGNNIFSNNNNNNNNNGRNLFANNNNNNGGNNIFTNQNQNNGFNNGGNSFSNEFALIKALENSTAMLNSIIHQQRKVPVKRNNTLESLYYGDQYMTNSQMYNANGFSINNTSYETLPSFGISNTNGIGYNGPRKEPVPFDNYNFYEAQQPINTQLTSTSSNPYTGTTATFIMVKSNNDLEKLEEDFFKPKIKRTDQSRIIDQQSRINGDHSFYKTKSEFLEEEIQMRQISKVNARTVQNTYNPQKKTYQLQSTINHDQSQDLYASNDVRGSLLTKKTQINNSQTQSTRKINLPEGYIYKPKNFEGFIVQDFQITNEFGTVRWPGKLNVKNIDFSKNFKILSDRVECEIPELNRECFATFFSIPAQLIDLDEKEAFKLLYEYLKIQTKGCVELQMLSLNPRQYRIKIKNIFYEHQNPILDAEFKQ